MYIYIGDNIDGLAQDCSNSIANAPELLQSCTKPSISTYIYIYICVFFFCYCVVYGGRK